MHSRGRIGADRPEGERATRPPDAMPPAARDLLALQHSAGNRAVAGMLSRARLDRFITTPTRVLDRTSGMEDVVDSVAAHLVATEAPEKALGHDYVRDELAAVVDLELGLPNEISSPAAASMAAVSNPLRDQIRRERDARHMRWLDGERARFEAALGSPDPRGLTLRTDAELRRGKHTEHYRELDQLIGLPDVIWRFTSNPQTEVIKIDANVGFDQVVEIVNKHTGGNKKDDGRVRTLSFGRNLGALIGVAYSKGGDPNVAEIAVRAEYLYGVPLRSLQGQGITAHPAESRLIGIFETEYVLLATPGDPPRRLDDIAPIKLRNPFKGMDGKDGRERLLEGKQLASEQLESAVGEQKEKPAPRTVEVSAGPLRDAPPQFSATVREYAHRIQAAATELSGNVRMPEGADSMSIDAALRVFQEKLKAYDGMHPKPDKSFAGPRY